jgi:hypothetical protein
MHHSCCYKSTYTSQHHTVAATGLWKSSGDVFSRSSNLQLHAIRQLSKRSLHFSQRTRLGACQSKDQIRYVSKGVCLKRLLAAAFLSLVFPIQDQQCMRLQHQEGCEVASASQLICTSEERMPCQSFAPEQHLQQNQSST